MIANEIRKTLQNVCAILNQHKVDYIVVGGVAVGFHGYQRLSVISNYKPELKTDLDFWQMAGLDSYTVGKKNSVQQNLAGNELYIIG